MTKPDKDLAYPNDYLDMQVEAREQVKKEREERKNINIYAYDMKPTICVSYMVEVDTFKEVAIPKYITFWARKDMLESFDFLYTLRKFMRKTETVKTEKDIYREYQKMFSKLKWINYVVEKEKFKTQRVARVKKPYRDFELVTKEFIEKQIETIIMKEEK
jgi:hypothetical protein